MKRIIITPAQLRMINEAQTAFSYNGSEPNSFEEEYTEFTTKNPTAKSSVIKAVNTSDTAKQPATTDTGDSQDAQQVIIPPETNQGSIVSETRYTKRQVELGRMLEMRRTGKIYSKKQLNEMFLETQENAKRLRDGIGDCFLKDIFDAIEEVFPEKIDDAKEAFKNGADLPEYIITSIFGKDDVDSEREEEFLDMLGL